MTALLSLNESANQRSRIAPEHGPGLPSATRMTGYQGRFSLFAPTSPGDIMSDKPINGREPNFSEEDLQREELGPRGVPGEESPTKMTPQREKKKPKTV